jgi:hypothetical protein
VEVIGRLLVQAGIRRSPWPARGAHRRHATGQRLTQRAAQLGFASLPAYLADRVVQQAWSLARVVSGLGCDPRLSEIDWTAVGARIGELAGRHLPTSTPTTGSSRTTAGEGAAWADAWVQAGP